MEGLTEAKARQVALGVQVSDIASVLTDMSNAFNAVKGDVADLSISFRQAQVDMNKQFSITIQAAGRDILNAFSAQATQLHALQGLAVQTRDTMAIIQSDLRAAHSDDLIKRLDTASVRELLGQLLQLTAAGAVERSRRLLPVATDVVSSQETAALLVAMCMASADGADHALFVVLAGVFWFASRMAKMYVQPVMPHFIIVVDFCGIDTQISFDEARSSQVRVETFVVCMSV